MKKENLLALEKHLTDRFKEIFENMSIHEMRKLDWLSTNPDYYIQKDKK